MASAPDGASVSPPERAGGLMDLRSEYYKHARGEVPKMLAVSSGDEALLFFRFPDSRRAGVLRVSSDLEGMAQASTFSEMRSHAGDQRLRHRTFRQSRSKRRFEG